VRNHYKGVRNTQTIVDLQSGDRSSGSQGDWTEQFIFVD